jgi:membrane-bound lytic murein transglycosylase A
LRTRHAAAGLFSVAAALLGMTMAAFSAPPPTPAGARAEATSFAALEGWAGDDHAAAYAAFLISCDAMLADAPALRPAIAALPNLKTICAKAATLRAPSKGEARAFFEAHFTPYRIVPDTGAGFLTGYFEPEIEGSLTRTAAFPAPVYGRPADLVTLQPGDDRQGLDPALAAARRTPQGLEPYPPRSAIYAGLLAGQGLEQLYLRDEPEVFIVQVQGSARVRLQDGRRVRLTYAGRNGHPYTSIGRMLIEEGRIARDQMSLAALMGWLRANPDDARRIMEANRSYVFFQREDDVDPARGPTGGAGVPLTPHRSLAIDRAVWPYGLPVFASADIETLTGPERQIRRLMIAQDTGSAIVGPARADYFWGSGDGAGIFAGLTRHALGFTVLWPR